jgi:hypothetical protein
MFIAPLDDGRKRYLLRHLPLLTEVRALAGDAKELFEQQLIDIVDGKPRLTEAGRQFLEIP